MFSLRHSIKLIDLIDLHSRLAQHLGVEISSSKIEIAMKVSPIRKCNIFLLFFGSRLVTASS